MKVRILTSAPSEPSGPQYLSTFLVDDAIAIDAGCLGLHQSSPDACPCHVFLTHAHIDHVGTLPLFLENGHGRRDEPVRVYGPAGALASVQDHFFNDRVWVDYTRWKGEEARVALRPLEPDQVVRVGRLNITGIPVEHPVPTFGYIVDDGTSAVAFGADSSPTTRLWEAARATGRLRAVFLECSFPNSHGELARKTGHMTPQLWIEELEKLPPDVTVLAVHIKPHYSDRVIAELKALNDPRVRVAEIGREYQL